VKPARNPAGRGGVELSEAGRPSASDAQQLLELLSQGAELHVHRRISGHAMCAAIMLTTVAAVFPAAAAEQGGEPISIGQRFQIESKLLGETRKYIVHTRATTLSRMTRTR
jgi:hypothetical protein